MHTPSTHRPCSPQSVLTAHSGASGSSAGHAATVHNKSAIDAPMPREERGASGVVVVVVVIDSERMPASYHAIQCRSIRAPA
jgi:hypothetical protein